MDSKLANVSDIPENGGIVVTSPEDGSEIALLKYQGKVYALDNICPHQGGPLGEGTIEEGCVTCPWHGWQFNVETGVCQNIPGEEARKIAVEVVDGAVFLKGNPQVKT
jgi:nitrite reductase (NADH) small subunit